jgi:hypothetical protein
MNVGTLKYEDGPSPATIDEPSTIEKEHELDAEKHSADYESSPPGSTSGHDDGELVRAYPGART